MESSCKVLRDMQIAFIRKDEYKLRCSFRKVDFDLEWESGGGGSLIRFKLTQGETKMFTRVFEEVSKHFE